MMSLAKEMTFLCLQMKEVYNKLEKYFFYYFKGE